MAAKLNLTIDQGSTFTQNVVVNDLSGNVQDLTNHTSRGAIRAEYEDATATVLLTTAIPTPANGTVVLSLTAAQTEAIEAGRYVYDVELINSITSTVTRIVQGTVTVYPEVTKDDGPAGGNFAA